MIRKFAAALVALVIAVGAVFADTIKGTFVKFADGKLTIKVDDKEKDYKIPSDLKVKYNDGDEATWQSLNLCNISKVTLFWDRKNEATRAVTE